MKRADHRRHGASGLLALAWVALIVYASLFPFTGWRWPPGAQFADVLRLPWSRWIGSFDVVSNLLGYLPLGLFAGLALRRSGSRWRAVLPRVAMLAAALSYTLEVTQHLVPGRAPSLLDWELNTAGAVLGALVAGVLRAAGWAGRIERAHDRWLQRGGDAAVVLLLLWPVALLFPAPVPLGLGQVGWRLREFAAAWVDDVVWALPLADWLGTLPVAPAPPTSTVTLTVALGLLAPCLLAFAASRPGWRRALLAIATALVALLATTLSTALNFGPDHALAWRTPAVLGALAAALVVALALAWIGPRLAGGLALVVLTGLVMLVHQVPSDAYFAQSLQGWEQGRFIRFHGLAQWVGWLWPYAAMVWLLARLRARD